MRIPSKKSIIIVYVTTPDRKSARQIAKAAVTAKLAACGNILPKMESIYSWQGKMQDEKECVLLLKTAATHFAKLKKLIVKHHSYQCPCIVAWPITHGHADYLEWIESSL